MRKTLRLRFWFEACLAAVTGLLLVLTAAVPDWIEELGGGDPDGGDGSLEWLLVVGLVLATVTFVVLARVEWRRAALALGGSSGA